MRSWIWEAMSGSCSKEIEAIDDCEWYLHRSYRVMSRLVCSHLLVEKLL